MTEYLYESLENKPNLGYLEEKISTSLPDAPFQELSYHRDAKWLKVWFESDLSAEDKTTLDGLVADAQGVTSFRFADGYVFFELFQADNKRWQKHTRRVNFDAFFSSVPTITVSNAYFDGAADIEIINVTQRYFDFRVTATKSANRSRGFNTVEFQWRAEWQV